MAHSHKYFREQPDLNSEVERLVGYVSEGQGQSSFATYCHAISPVMQKGPMCGLVCLTMATQLLEGTRRTHHHTATADKTHPESILEYAVQRGLSVHGEMFSCRAMERIIVEHLHLGADVVSVESSDTLQDLVVQIVSGQKAVLVPYDADKDHTPCLALGHSAHWCLLVGLCLVIKPDGKWAPLTQNFLEHCWQTPTSHHYVVRETCMEDFTALLKKMFDSQSSMKESLEENLIHVFARHGKTAHLGMWSLRELLLSNGNLMHVDPRRSNPLEYVIPKGGLEEGLRNRIIFVTK